MVNVFDFVDESRHSSWAELLVEFWNLQENKNSRIWRVFNVTQNFVKEHSEGILNVKCLDYSSLSWRDRY